MSQRAAIIVAAFTDDRIWRLPKPSAGTSCRENLAATVARRLRRVDAVGMYSTDAVVDAVHEMCQDAPLSRCLGTFTAAQVTQILALACEPEKSGRPVTHWTNVELTDEVLKQKIMPRISVSTVGRSLRMAALGV